MGSPPIITFSSDFGSSGPYVGAVKGAILKICPQARIVDISHEISSHNILEGAFNLACSYSYFPAGTVHLAVVDPGVGSQRRGIAVSTERHHFVGPDNGLFTLIYRREKVKRVISIESERHCRETVSPTFHGRDVFGPAAAWLARGTAPEQLGPEVTDWRSLPLTLLQREGSGRVAGVVLQVDRFGNVITSVHDRELRDLLGYEPALAEFSAGGRAIARRCRTYADAPAGELVYLKGSSGYYEIAVSEQSAAGILGLKVGDPVQVTVRSTAEPS